MVVNVPSVNKMLIISEYTQNQYGFVFFIIDEKLQFFFNRRSTTVENPLFFASPPAFGHEKKRS